MQKAGTELNQLHDPPGQRRPGRGRERRIELDQAKAALESFVPVHEAAGTIPARRQAGHRWRLPRDRPAERRPELDRRPPGGERPAEGMDGAPGRRGTGRTAGLGPLLELVLRDGTDITHLVRMFRKRLFTLWIDSFRRHVPLLANFNSAEHNALIAGVPQAGPDPAAPGPQADVPRA